MINYIILLFLDAAIIFLLARIMPQIVIRSYGKAILAAFLIGLVNVLLGWLLRGLLNVVTLGLVSSIISLVVTAVMIKLVDKLMGSFEVKGFWPALVIAVAIALAHYLVLGTGV